MTARHSASRRLLRRFAIAAAAASGSLLSPAAALAAVPTGWSLRSATDGGTSALGSSIATSQTVAAVGAPFATPESGRGAIGAVFIYLNAGGTWTPQEITAPSPVVGADFGTAVAVSGNLLAVGAGGAPRAAYLFVADAGSYESLQTWTDPATDTNGSFGGSVAVFAGPGASYVAVAAPSEGSAAGGIVYVSRQVDGGAWSNPPLSITDPSAQSFGIAIAFAGNGELLVGDPDTGGGQVLVYAPDADGGWANAGTLTFSLDGWSVQQFGNGIATAGNLAVVTAPGTSDDAGAYNGAAFVFASNDAGIWTQEAVLMGTAAESFGNGAPAVQSGLIAIGSALNTSTGGAGQVDVWAASDAGSWVSVPSTALTGDSYYGQAVGIVGSVLFVGDTSALGASTISDVTSSLFIETAQYPDAGASGSEAGPAGETDGSDGVDGSGATLDGSFTASVDGASQSGGATAVGAVPSGSGCSCTSAAQDAGPGTIALLTECGLAFLAWGRRRSRRSPTRSPVASI
jgi:hypothetical protein